MRIKLLTPRDRLSPKLLISPPRKKFKTIFRSSVDGLEEDEEQTCSDKIRGRGG
jgi:hypothetical protein